MRSFLGFVHKDLGCCGCFPQAVGYIRMERFLYMSGTIIDPLSWFPVFPVGKLEPC